MKKKLPVFLLFVLLVFFVPSSSAQHCNFGLTYTTSACGACVQVGGGAVLPVSFLWDTLLTGTCYADSIPGTHFVTVTDANGCWDTITVTIISQPPLHVTMTPIGNPSCPCYSFGLDHSTAPLFQGFDPYDPHPNPFCNIPPGTYQVSIMDVNGCHADTEFTVSASALHISTVSTSALCRNGTATVTVNGGVAPYSYLWNSVPPQTDSMATGLFAGRNYTITVTDDSGCVQTEDVRIQTNSNLSSGVYMVPDTCSHSVGSLTAYGLAGFPPYQFYWNTNDTTASLSNLSSGYFYVWVTDDSGCVAGSGVQMADYSPVISTASVIQPSCTSYTGSITLTTSGGTAPYQYTWNTVPVQLANVATGLKTGNYSCTITDQQGCMAMVSALVTDSSDFQVQALPTSDICGKGTGSVSISTVNGIPPFTYQWNSLPPDTNHVLSNLHAGHVQCIVTDQSQCVRKAMAYVPVYSPVHVNVTPHNASCVFNADGWAVANVTGAVPPLTFSWTGDTSHTKTNLPPGNYSCYVTDAIGCSSYRMYTIGYDSVLPCAVNVVGTVFNDAILNCSPDLWEAPISGSLVGCMPYGGFRTTDNQGRFSFFLPPGNYHVWQPQLPPWKTTICSSDYYDTLPMAGMSDTNNFAYTGNAMDLAVNCFSNTLPRPGFTFTQAVGVSNLGTQYVMNAVLKIKHDSLVTFLSSVPATSNYDSTNRIITVNLPWLNPSGNYSSEGQVLINYLVPPTVSIGTVLNFTDTIFPVAGDTVAFNNYFNCSDVVVGSFDPNSIEVNPAGTGTPGYITTNDSVLTYLVHFQNTGNYPAQNVVLKMQLDPDLDWSTFRTEGGSFEYAFEISPEGMAVVSFLNIFLPDSTYDEPGSHGYFAFSIKQNNGLLPDTTILERADILFDFNSPVTTNTALNTIYVPAGIQDIAKEGFPISIYPNPTTGRFLIQLDLKKAGYVSFDILDAIGQQLISKSILFVTGKHFTEFDISAYPPGIYFVRISSGDVNNVLKITKF